MIDALRINDKVGNNITDVLRIIDKVGDDIDITDVLINFKVEMEQAGAELCQAQHSFCMELDTN